MSRNGQELAEGERPSSHELEIFEQRIRPPGNLRPMSLGDGGSVVDVSLSRAIASAVRSGDDVETLTRPLLELLGQLSGLESTYLTEIREDLDEQSILISRNAGQIEIPEGLTVQWSDTLCRRALETGERCTSDVSKSFPGSQAAKALGLNTYVSVPMLNADKEIVGTLCGASGSSIEVAEPILELMEVFARLISDQRERDRRTRLAEDHAQFVERRLSQRAMFLAVAEHKLKSPLTAILGWSSMLHEVRSSFDEAQLATAIATINESSQQLRRQVDELLEEAQAEVLVGEMDLTSVDVRAILERAVNEQADAINLDFRFVIETPVLTVWADRTALWQVVSHLLDNAIKYSGSGRVITLRALETRNSIIVEVADEGIGLPDDMDVFAPFARADRAVATGATGSGLGLHVVRNLVEAMGGVVSARNNAARGATFSVVLVARERVAQLAATANESQ